MLTFPATPKPNAEQIRELGTTLISVSQSGHAQARTFGGSRWAFDLTYPPLDDASARGLYGFMAGVGQASVFSYTSTVHSTPRGSASAGGTYSVKIAASVGDSAVWVQGFNSSATGVLLAGDFIRFAGHSKVYLIGSDVVTDSTGAALIQVYPDVISPIALLEAVTLHAIPFDVRLAAGSLPFAMRAPFFGYLTASLEEAV